MTFLKIAWKNLFRNTRRTIIAGSGIGMGLAVLIFADSFMAGMSDNMIDNATGTFLGHGQIHAPLFRENGEVEHAIINPEKTIRRIDSMAEIKDHSERVIIQALVGSASKSQSIALWGVDRDQEKKLSMMDDRLSPKSEYLPRENSILIGQGLADELGIVLGERLIITAAKAETGEPMQELFIVDGIYSFGSKEMDMAVAMVNRPAAQRLIGFSDNQFHEIAFTLNDPSLAQNKDLPLWNTIGGENLAEPWVVLMSELQMVIEMSSFSKWIMVGILFFIVGLNIINTLFMAIYERFFEFAVLKSIGTGRFQLFRMIVYEAASLAIIASVIGVIMGYILTKWVMIVGVNFNNIEYSGLTFYEKIYPIMVPSSFVTLPTFLILFTIVISCYPALYAARMTPAEALKKTL